MASSGKKRSTHRPTAPATTGNQQNFIINRQVLNNLYGTLGAYCFGRRVNPGELNFMEVIAWAQTRYEEGERVRTTGQKGQQTGRGQQQEKAMAAGGGNT